MDRIGWDKTSRRWRGTLPNGKRPYLTKRGEYKKTSAEGRAVAKAEYIRLCAEAQQEIDEEADRQFVINYIKSRKDEIEELLSDEIELRSEEPEDHVVYEFLKREEDHALYQRQLQKAAAEALENEEDNTLLINNLYHDYVKALRADLALVEAGGIPRGRKKQASTVGADIRDLRKFATFMGDHKFSKSDNFDEDNLINAKVLSDFRVIIEDWLISKKYKPATLNGYLKSLRTFLGWLVQEQFIRQLPPNTVRACRKFEEKSKPKPLKLEHVHLLWEGVKNDDWWKPILLMGLNTGIYSSDFSIITAVQFRTGTHWCGQRKKTGEFVKIKLWKETLEAIQPLLSECGDGLVFTTKEGLPFWETSDFGEHHTIDRMGTRFRNFARANGVATSWSSIRDTSTTMIEQIARKALDIDVSGASAAGYGKQIASQFDGHKDGRQARSYISIESPEHLETTALDKCVEQLRLEYGLFE